MKYSARYIAILLFTLIGITNIHSQNKKDYTIGVNFVTSFDNENIDVDNLNYGISAKFQYHLFDLVRLQPSLTYFFRKEYLGPLDLSIDIHPLIYLSEQFVLYPLAGAGFMVSEIPKVEDKSSVKTNLCLNLGGGIDCWLGSNIVGNIEFKVKNIRKDSWFNASIGIAYLF